MLRDRNLNRWCFVPMCKSTDKSTPGKIFVSVPYSTKIRMSWWLAARRQLPMTGTHFYCCEDHFNLKEDMENFLYYSMMGGRIRLKPGVMPHKFDCQGRLTPQIENRETLQRKRMMSNLGQDVMEPSSEFVKVDMKEEPVDNHVSSSHLFSSSQQPSGVDSVSDHCEDALSQCDVTDVKEEDVWIKEEPIEDEDLITGSTTTFSPKWKFKLRNTRSSISVEEFELACRKKFAANNIIFERLIVYQETKTHAPGLTDSERRHIWRVSSMYQWNEKDKILYYKGRRGSERQVVRSFDEMSSLLKLYHSSPIGGHSGWNATYGKISKKYTWKRMVQDIKDYIATCGECHRYTHIRTPASTVQPIKVKEPWEGIGVDMIDPVPEPGPGDQPATTKRNCRCTSRKRTREQLGLPLPPPGRGMKVKTTNNQERRMTSETTQGMVATTSKEAFPTLLPRTSTVPLSKEQLPAKVAPWREQATQTAVDTEDRVSREGTNSYHFQEADLVNLLIVYEHLVEQQQQARAEHCPHEPALSFVRRMLREGKMTLPRFLPVSRPLKRFPVFFNHVGEPDWVNYLEDTNGEHDPLAMDDDTLLLDESRDLMEQELARPLS